MLRALDRIYSPSGLTMIFARNTSRGKNGKKPSSGSDTRESSGLWRDGKRCARLIPAEHARRPILAHLTVPLILYLLQANE